MDLAKIVSLGKELGYAAEPLQKFVAEQVAIQEKAEQEKLEREERAQQREEKQREREEREHERQREHEEREREHESKFKLQIIERELELEKQRGMNQSHDTSDIMSGKKSNHSCSIPKAPRMPPFDDNSDNIDAYLQRFERIATSQGWDKSQWATYLSTLLKGRALEVYSRMVTTDADDYTVLKAALLKRYDMTEEGFRCKFRSAKLDLGETFSQFIIRLENYFIRWVELSSTDKSFEGVKDLLLKEQLLNMVNRELNVFLKERNPSSAKEMATLAEQFLDARGGPASYHKPNKAPSPNFAGNKFSGNKPMSGKPTNDSNKKPFISVSDRRCFLCSKVGHMARECPNRRVSVSSMKVHYRDGDHEKTVDATRDAEEAREEPSIMTGAIGSSDPKMPVQRGFVCGKAVNVLRDSGCSGVVIKQSIVDKDCMTDETQTCVLVDGTKRTVPVAFTTIDTPYYTGMAKAACMECPTYDLILGNIPGVREPSDPDLSWCDRSMEAVSAVETRSQRVSKEKGLPPLKTPKDSGIGVTREELIRLQEQDTSMGKLKTLAISGLEKRTGNNVSSFYYHNGVMLRKFMSPNVDQGKDYTQVVVPQSLRTKVMNVAHESLMGGHLGVRKTVDRVQSQFYWPGLHSDIKRHCMSCDICQRTVPKGRVGKIPLGQMPLIETPFERIAVDLIGPLYPVTDRGNRYILTIVDYATRYPEAVALPRIKTENVAEALLEVFTRVGVPKEILTDMGSQFTSGVMKEVSRLLSLKQLTTTPYHPMCNGLVERFNGTLKSMLRKMSAERPKDWDRYLPALLFAYREVEQESLGFSPFELLYGRTVRGPLKILRELWTGEVDNTEVRTTYQYVFDLRNRLEETVQIVQDELRKSSSRYRKYYNTKAKNRQMKVGDKVLILLPTDNNKLLMQWKGPFQILEKFGIGNYRVNVLGKMKTFHANLLKKYIGRPESNVDVCTVGIGSLEYVCAGLVDVDFQDDNTDMDISEPEIVSPNWQAKETAEDVVISDELNSEQQQQVKSILHLYSDVLTDLPGRTDCTEYKIRLTSQDPIRSKPYPVPHHMREIIKEEIDAMLQMDVIEPSESPYASPIVLVRKKDGTYRFCSDFRKINQITVFDCEPIPHPESLYTKLSNGKYFSKVDLSKGYWQIRMEEKSKEMTAFVTTEGLFQWKVMPFGVVNAPAVFSRMMRKVLYGMDNVENFIDDILIATETWESHVSRLRELLERLRAYHLTARPSKCAVGVKSLEFLGHVVGNGQVQPEQGKIDKILNVSIPLTKKQVRSFIGLISFYQKYIPNFSAIAAPLTDLTRKGKPNQVEWSDSQQRAFDTLKEKMSTSPILKLPDLSQKFILRTDASDVGLGAVLLQEHDGNKFPVMYGSRKLLDRERSFSTIEKECLAIIWSVQKFQRFLYGNEFILETDHQPLVWMTKAKLSNGRVMRWALSLQPYRFVIHGIKGVDNVGADVLSRCVP